VQVSYQILSFLSIQTEALFTMDTATFWMRDSNDDIHKEEYSSQSLMFPLVLKGTIRTGRFLIAPFVGMYGILPLSSGYSIDGPPIGFTAGSAFGVQVGPGTLFLDARYAVDLKETVWDERPDYWPSARPDDYPSYQRSMLSLTVGYEWGFFKQPNKKSDRAGL
jgi:hypothetical protein